MLSMSQGFQLTQNLSLKQVLAPQMQQSLALLQAATLELKALVEQEMQQNPVLEELSVAETDRSDKAERGEGDPASVQLDPAEPPLDVKFDPATERPSNQPVDDFQAEFEKLSQMDQEWREHFSQTNIPLRSKDEDDEKRQFMFDTLVAKTSLQEDLLEQARFSELEDSQQPIAELIIGNLDDSGFLKTAVDELALGTNIPANQILEVLAIIQTFHPPGVAARDLRECLLLQLERGNRKNSLEYKIISDHMDNLGRRKFPDIAKALDVSVFEVQRACARISHLNPRPGGSTQSEDGLYIVPEVFVKKDGDEFVVTGNEEHVPRLRISNHYKDLMANPESSSEVRDYIRNKIQAGKFLIKSIGQRQTTILNIAKEIVKRQQEFMAQGVSALRPMTMAQVAEVVGVHETTVSRAVAGKYIETPQGIFEMKYFFTSGIQNSSGDGLSNETVKEMISVIFRDEDPRKPISDQEVVDILTAKGIVIARRTVAKYRTELNILPSNLRKVY